MAPAVASLAAAITSSTDVQYMFEHIFLPPKLPQQDDPETAASLDPKLIQATYLALRAFRDYCTEDKLLLNSAIGGLQALNMTLIEGVISEEELLIALHDLASGKVDVVPLHIRAQNAGVIITRREEGLTFEAFELSATNEAIIHTTGRLTRHFPGCAALVSDADCQQKEFQAMLAYTLSRMSSQPVPGMQPKSAKGGTQHDEERDTTHPGAVTELLLGGVLRGIGKPFAAARITKHTRDEVLWKDAETPWRRSPMWTLLRVYLQLTFIRADFDKGHKLYKAFVTFLAASVLNRALTIDVFDSRSTLFAMSAKVTRRLLKLDTQIVPALRADIQAVLDSVGDALRGDWNAIQSHNKCSLSLFSLRSLNFEADSITSVPDLTAYIESTRNRNSKATSSEPILTTGYVQYPDDCIPPESFLRTADQYTPATLSQFESWVPKHLSKNLNNHEVDDACRLVYRLLREYYEVARKTYSGSSEMLSIMVLTIFEIWVACDKRATKHYPQLAEYDVEIPLSCLRSLLLPIKSQLDRLRTVELYFAARQRGVRHEAKYLFGDPVGEAARKSFAVRYFDSSPDRAELHRRFAEIQLRSESQKDQKIQELARRKSEQKDLERQAAALECVYREKTIYTAGHSSSDRIHDKDRCQKCALRTEAAAIKIHVFEAFLPKNENEAKAIVFELRAPIWFSSWRDCTVMLLSDVLKSDYSSNRPGLERDDLTLPKNKRLEDWYREGTRRVIMASGRKGQNQTHYGKKAVTDSLSEDEVCVANGLQYRYLDKVRKQFIGGMVSNDYIAPLCTYILPSASKPMSRFLVKTSRKDCRETPNTVLASQRDRPDHLKSDEYTELCTLPHAFETQWHELAFQFHTPGIDFNKTETGIFVLQCLYQTGPPGDNGAYRVAHGAVTSADFATRVLRSLEDSLEKIGDNWESANALAVFAATANRILTLSTSIDIQKACKAFLMAVCDTAFKWVGDLRERSHSAAEPQDRKDSRVRAMQVALVCVACYDVDDRHLSEVLGQQHHVSRLVQCFMILAQREYNNPSPLAAVLLMRFKRMLQRSHRLIASNQAGLDSAVSSMWSQYRPGNGQWSRLADSLAHWVTKKTTSPTGLCVTIHYDLLSGKLLVNGTRLLQPPAPYRKAALFKALFGDLDVEVMPSGHGAVPYMISRPWAGFEVHLGWASITKDLLVVAIKDGVEYEVIPSHIFHGNFPRSFELDFVHWLHKPSGTINFRPKSDPWNLSSAENLYLRAHHQDWLLARGGVSLLGLNSPSSARISQILSPLVDATDMHIYLLDTMIGEVEIDLPTIQMGFKLLNDSEQLQSREFPDMIVDTNQTIDTLYGLFNKLLLRPKTTTGKRRLLLPEGHVDYEQDSVRNMSLAVDKTSITKIHALIVNDSIGCLEDNGSLQCKLYVAYLHALTSFCLPDPLTKKTGTEQALSILNSAATRSLVSQLSPANTALLCKIARLTPGRTCYPSKDSKPMQTVDWDRNLGYLSQHGRFCEAVKSIIRQSDLSAMFYPESKSRLPDIDHAEKWLVERDLARSSTFRRSGFGAENHPNQEDAGCKARDDEYNARDCDNESERSFYAFTISHLIATNDGRPHWPVPKPGYLSEIAKNMLLICGPGSKLEEGMLKYDASLFQSTPESMLQQLPVLQSSLAGNSTSADKFALIMWLSTMAFAGNDDLPMIQMMALCSTAAPIRAMRPPRAKTFDPSVGCPAKNGHGVKKILAVYVKEAAKPFEQTPAAKRDGCAGARRRIYDQKVAAAAENFVRNCADWWRTGTIKTPKLGEHESFLNGDAAANIVKERFRMLRHNVELYEYFDKLQLAAHGLPSNNVELEHNPLRDPRYVANARSGIVSVRDLFSGPAPALQVAPPTIEPQAVIDEKEEESSFLLNPLGVELGVLVNRMAHDASDFQEQYLKSLKASRTSLNSRQTIGPPIGHDSSKDVISQHLDACQTHRRAVQEALKSCATAAFGDHERSKIHLPQVSQTLLLQQLNRHHWPRLSGIWKTCIIAYGLALAAEQRAERLLKACRGGNWDEVAKELKNVGHTNWNPFEYPETLLLEVESGIMIREVQEQIASQMRDPPSGRNSMMQLNMGEGKSSVIVPMVAAALADGDQLVRVIVAKPQSAQMAQMLISKLGGLLDRRIFHMPFSRAVKLTPSRASDVQKLCRQCMAEGGIMLVQPEHILSFQLMGPECFVSKRENAQEIGSIVLSAQDFLDKFSRDIVDEADENFDCRFELIYTMGLDRPIEMKPQRWSYIQEILGLLRKCVKDMATERPMEFEFDNRGHGSFPRVRILNHSAGQRLLERISTQIVEEGLSGFPEAGRDVTENAVFRFISVYDLTPEEIHAVKTGPHWTKQYRKTLLLLRGMFACGLLSFAFEQKRWRVNYGLAERTPPTRLAVPYRAKDCPSLRAEFSHPDVVIVVTCLSYYYGGLEDEHLFLALGHLLGSDQKDVEYQGWIKDTDMPAAFRDLSGINLKDTPTCVSVVFPHLKFVKMAIDYFLSHVVFEKGMREFAHKMSASGWDIGKVKNHPTTGFSGTNDAKALLPLDVTHLDLEHQRHTNALVMNHLLEPGNSVALMKPSRNPNMSGRLLDMVLSLNPTPEVILDVGAQILEFSNEDFAKLWLKSEYRTNKEAAIFCNDADELTVVDMKGNKEPLQTSSFATRMDACLVYLDEAHTRGIDLKLPIHYRAAVTLGAEMTKDRLVQACMRMRQLGKGQTVVFCISEEIQTKILKEKDISPENLRVMDVLQWAMQGTFASIERSLPLWVTQGHRYALQEGLWSKLGAGNRSKLTPELAKEFLEPEARTIEYRYSPGREFNTQLDKISNEAYLSTLDETVKERLKMIRNHTRRFRNLPKSARRLLEEQERELSPEKEQQRTDECASAATPTTHYLHPDLVKFVQTGRKPADTNALLLAFHTLDQTTAAKDFDVAGFGSKSSEHLWATPDFATTVKPIENTEHTSDAFLRPVHWILTIRKPNDTVVGTVILISPYEARMLMKYVRTSQFAALHQYRPRINIRHASLDQLDFLTIRQGSGKLTISSQLITQLNVFAGQLYFSSYTEYANVCDFLGMTHRNAPPQWQVDPDRFIRQDGNGQVGGMSGLNKSPVAFLKVFYGKIRRQGEDISKTHMGRLLGGELLRVEDFAATPG